jgi:transposase-like protein
LQRSRCQTCKRNFNALTGTSLAHLQMKDKWLDFSETMVQPQTLRQAAATLGVHRNTTLRRRHRS